MKEKQQNLCHFSVGSGLFWHLLDRLHHRDSQETSGEMGKALGTFQVCALLIRQLGIPKGGHF